MQRVLVVSNMYPTPEHPVGGIFVHEQVQALRRAGLDVRVVSGYPLFISLRHPRSTYRKLRQLVRARWPGWDAHDGVPVARFPFLAGSVFRAFTFPWTYAAQLRRWLPALAAGFPYDVVHAHTAFLDGRAALAAARQRGVPLVLTEHTGPLTQVTATLRMRLHAQAGVRGADRLLAVSNALRQDMLQQLRIPDPARLTTLPNGVDTSFFDPARVPATDRRRVRLADVQRVFEELAASLGRQHTVDGSTAASRIREALAGTREFAAADPWSDPDAVHALWVGHHVEVKRIDRLLEAFAIARRHQPRLLLTLLGSGELELQARRQAQRLGLLAHVRFLPAASREGVREQMARADFLVLPSQSETFGVVIIEALAMGLPVLATDCGGPADVLADPTLGLLAGNTLEDIALGLQRMARTIRDFDRGQIRRTAVARYDYARLAERLKSLYQELADSRSPAAKRVGLAAMRS